MNRSSMYQTRWSVKYLNGVNEFLNMAFQKTSANGKNLCPCVKCGNGMWVTQSEAVDHLLCDGFIKGYTKWIAHGEFLSSIAHEESSSTNRTAGTPCYSDKDLDMHDNVRDLIHDVWGTTPSRGSSYRMAIGWKTELEKINHRIEELRAMIMEQRGTNGVNPSSVGVTSPNQHIISGFQGRPIKTGDNVFLKTITNRKEIVGKGRVINMDPSAMVGGVELGVNWCEVHVLVPINWDEHLIRPYGGLKKVGDVNGTPIAWPLSLVMLDEDD